MHGRPPLSAPFPDTHDEFSELLSCIRVHGQRKPNSICDNHAWRKIGSNQHDKVGLQKPSLSLRELAKTAKVSKATAEKAKKISTKATPEINGQFKIAEKKQQVPHWKKREAS